MNRKHFFLFLVALSTLSVRTAFAAGNPSDLIINEIQVANIDLFIDPSYNYGGWVELYNPTDGAITITGLYVSEDASNLKMFKLPSGIGTVPAHGYKNLWFDHYDTGNKYSSVASRQVNFKLNYEGGTIYISNASGQILLSQDFPQAVQRCSYARTTDGGDEWRMCATPTPAATNEGSTFADEQLPMPEVDTDAMVYSSTFTFNVAIPDGAKLRYTTDGSTPTLTNGQVSTTGSFTVRGSSKVYRFRLFKDGYLPSSVVTRSFIYKDKDYYLPIVSVVTDSKNLYDDNIGAYTVGTNGISGLGVSYATNKNRSWERPVNFEYLVPDDGGSFLMALNQECDFEVFGGWSRNQYAPNASFRLKGGKYYLGKTFLEYDFFKDKPYLKSKVVLVRNGGNDGNGGRIRDAGTHKIILTSGFYVDCQEVQPVHVFINGKFQFTFNLREPNNKNHGYANYGIDTDWMDQFELSGGYVQKTGDDTVFRQWVSLAKQLASTPNDNSIYDQLCDIVDIDEYTNYMAAECYVGCGDWYTNNNNAKGYRSKDDGKFHMVFMDLDSGFGTTSMISNLASNAGRNELIDIFLNMLKYEPFKKRFIDAFCLVDGSVFEMERCRQIVEAMVEEKYAAFEFEGLAGSLNSSANTLLNGINNGRTSRINNLRNYFGLSTPVTVELSSNVEGAAILANGQEVPTGKFKGSFFTPMVLTAKAPAGYRFVGWQKAGEGSMMLADKVFETNATWAFYDQGSLDGQNWTSASFNSTSWDSGQAPFGYGNIGINGSADFATTLDYGDDANNKRPTYYFRKRFNLSEAPTDEEAYVLKGFVDDGCVVYVNGHEVGRYLMPEGDITYSTFSTNYAGATAGQCSFTLDNQWLHAGSNVIAVEVHNTHEHSSDIYWTAELQHNTKGENALLSTQQELDLAAYAGTDLTKVIATYEALPEEVQMADLAFPLRINELSAGNSVFVNEYFKKNDWLELYNTTDADLNVAGLYISDKLDDPLKYQIPESTTLNTIVPAHGHLVIWADKLEPTTQLHVPFKLGNQDGDGLLIVSSEEFVRNNAEYFEAHPDLTDFADGIIYPSHAGDQSVGRYPDGSNDFYKFMRPTIRKQNTLLTSDKSLGKDTGIMLGDESTLDLDLAEGWNWMSHPFNNSLSVNYFKSFADYILDRSLEAHYSSEAGAMEGTLTSMLPNRLYKVDMTEAHTFGLNGRMPSNTVSMTVQQGWNWIGYPGLGMQTLDATFAANVDDGDVIMGQAGFSVYSAEDGWIGTLSTLIPGQGYMYRTSQDKKLKVDPVRRSVRLRRSPRRNASAYGPDPHAYPDVMGVIAQLQVEDQVVEPEPFTVIAEVDGECRGRGECVDGKVFMTLYGRADETLTLKALDEEGNELQIQETVRFVPSVEGSREQPIVWHMEDPAIVIVKQPMANGIAVMPVGYYNLSGTFMGSDASRLRTGFYIVRMADGSTRKTWKN